MNNQKKRISFARMGLKQNHVDESVTIKILNIIKTKTRLCECVQNTIAFFKISECRTTDTTSAYNYVCIITM